MWKQALKVCDSLLKLAEQAEDVEGLRSNAGVVVFWSVAHG